MFGSLPDQVFLMFFLKFVWSVPIQSSKGRYLHSGFGLVLATPVSVNTATFTRHHMEVPCGSS